MFTTLDQLLVHDEYNGYGRLENCVALADLDQVCDVKGDEDFRVYRYNEAKTLEWAKKKVLRLADALPGAGVQVLAGSQSSNFVKRSRDKEGDRASCISFALGAFRLPDQANIGPTAPSSSLCGLVGRMAGSPLPYC